MRTNSACSHSYQPVGDVYQPKVGERRTPRTPTKYNRAKFDVHTVYGPKTQRVFCSKCLQTGAVLAGDARPKK